MQKNKAFLSLGIDCSSNIIASKFTYPYLYQVSALSQSAVDCLKSELPEINSGMMFAVIIVETVDHKIGYLTAYTGKSLAIDCDIEFVPRLLNEADEQNLKKNYEQKAAYLKGEIEALQKSAKLAKFTQQLEQIKQQAAKEISYQKKQFSEAKKHRQRLRDEAEQTGNVLLIRELNQQSVEQKKALKKIKLAWQEKIDLVDVEIDFILNKISNLKEYVNNLSEVFFRQQSEQYNFTNILGKKKCLANLAGENFIDGAADEAIVKLLNYAFLHGLKPISFAQFWWGPSPQAEVRHHGRIYPVSQTKTKSILNHLLAGLTVEPDPLLLRLNRATQSNIIYQDTHLVVVNKPTDLLSVPGAAISNSVYSHMKNTFPEATGPLIVHRLDMATSGLMVIALNKNAHKHLQKQFIQRSVKKRYVAVLDGCLNELEGVIKLPLRPDLTDRPRQVVCDQYGRYAETSWKVISHEHNKTRVYFYPKTGRSHQLRMHAAHQQGLAIPIVGDDLYGVDSAERLHLHADLLGFVHPVTNEDMLFQLDADF